MWDDLLEKIGTLNETDARRKCDLVVREIYDELKRKAKRIKPENFAEYVVKLFRNPPRKAVLPPHIILHAIEANCAYYDDHYDDTVDHKKIGGILNLLKPGGLDCYTIYMIPHNLDLFLQYIHRHQLDAQKTEFSEKHLARYWKIFLDNEFTPKLFDDFEKKYGITAEKWFQCSYCTFAMMYNKLTIPLTFPIESERIPLSENDFHAYFNLSAFTVEQVKDKYTTSREKINREFHFLIRSCFLERPILRLPDNRLIAPIPELIFRHAGYGLHQCFEDIDKHKRCIGDSFQSYVGNVLNCLKSKKELFDNNDIEKVADGEKSCDFILSTIHENILVECKATLFTVNILTQNAITKSTSTTHICRGFEQVDRTVDLINQGIFESKIDKSKPCIGIIVTLGEIPAANSEWYFKEIIPSNVVGKKGFAAEFFKKTGRNPMIISINALENLIMYINSTNKSLLSIYDEKNGQSEIVVGDWETFLGNKISESKNVEPLAFVESVMTKFDKSLGLPQKEGD